MFEKVNPSHPDKIADRIAGAIVDIAYAKVNNPKIAVEVLIGHGHCTIIVESSVEITNEDVKPIVRRLVGDVETKLIYEKQDGHLAENQRNKARCGDNGIFKGVPLTAEQTTLKEVAKELYEKYQCDGKYIIDNNHLIVCQSNAKNEEIEEILKSRNYNLTINPLGYWTGGINVDAGATNRKLGSDMADSVTGGGLHGKDLSKADVSINIYAWLKAKETGKTVELCCAIGDEIVDGKPYEEIVEIARNYINEKGGFEKFAEWGLV